METVYLFFAEGSEEVEALAVVDILRRAGVETRIVSVTGDKMVTGAHGIRVEADMLMEEVDFPRPLCWYCLAGCPVHTIWPDTKVWLKVSCGSIRLVNRWRLFVRLLWSTAVWDC